MQANNMSTYTVLSEKAVWNIDDLCTYTGFKKSYVLKLTHLRQVPFYKRSGGKNLFFKQAEILEWLTEIKYEQHS